jgi:hypothetical protein
MYKWPGASVEIRKTCARSTGSIGWSLFKINKLFFLSVYTFVIIRPVLKCLFYILCGSVRFL